MFSNTASNLFGNQPSTGFGVSSFGTNKTTSAGGFSFAPTSTASASLLTFGGAIPKTTSNLFGALGTTATAFAFQPASKPGSIFGGGLGATSAVSKPGSVFSFQPTNTAVNLGLGLGSQNATQIQSQNQQSSVDVFYASLSQPMLFGDERDNVIARLNQLQAMLGTGTGFSALGPVNYTQDNAFSRFRGIAYNVLPTSSESDGLVCMELAKPFNEVIPMKQAIQDHLFRLLGGRPNYQLVIEEIRPAASADTNAEVIIKVVERQASDAAHNVPASDLANFLCSATIKPQLQSQLCVCRLTPEIAPSASQVNAYLETPPAGIDRRVWQQARADNPASDRLIPVPVVGYADLKRRRADQLLFGDQQRKSVKHLLSVTSDLQTQQLSTSQKIGQLKRKQIELNHRTLKLLAKQTVARRAGFAISADEEALRCALDHLWSEITSTRGLRGRINQLLPSVLAKTSEGAGDAIGSFADEVNGGGGSDTWWNRSEIMNDLKEYLSQRNDGIKEMRHLLKDLNETMQLLTEKRTVVGSSASGAVPGLLLGGQL